MTAITLLAIWCVDLACAGILQAETRTEGENFRVENEVFSEGQQGPTSRSTTIFYNGVVYDYLQEPDETIVFDQAGGRFTLLDGRRRVQIRLTTDEVAAFSQRLKHEAEKQPDPLLKFLAAPKFDEKFDQGAGKLTLSSPWLTYRLLLEDTVNEAIARQYREFSDALAELNMLLSPSARLPFPRMVVNEALANHRATPREVYLTMAPKKGSAGKRTTIRSQHRLSWEVTESDLSRLAQTRQCLDAFQSVNFDQYRKGGKR
jgi:hypothetical protein